MEVRNTSVEALIKQEGKIMSAAQRYNRRNRGIALIISMLFVLVFSALAVSFAAMSGSNVQLASNQHKVNTALYAAQSGLACGQYIIHTVALDSTNSNQVTPGQADASWTKLCTYLQGQALDGKTGSSTTGRFSDSGGAGVQIVTPAMNYDASGATFSLRFYRYDANCLTIKMQATGTDGPIVRRVCLDMDITKDRQVLSYAVASKARVWITGNSTIHGDLYSSWKYQNISPFNMTSDSKVDGIIGTILTNINPTTGKAGPDLYAGTTKMPYHLETLDANGCPRYDASGHKIISGTDQIQGQCEGINYNVNYGDNAANMPGMRITDYDTSQYKLQTTAIPSSSYNSTTVTEYAPHADGNYGQPAPSGGLKLTRYVCQNKTLTNALVPVKKNVVFKNCTFNGILYVDGGTSTNPNNIRFDNCTFNGPIVTTPSTDTSSGWWQRNQLYFTGTATFQNQTTVPATILAPNFSIDIGNTNPTRGDNNVLTGAIVGGIVDVRGHAQIYGTIISMFDTSSYSSGYVSNIGATLGDGGSETTDPGDVGVITITPDPDKLLPSGITSPIILKPDKTTYNESA
jgi:Tfp pilus assembly protein PilX